MNVESLIEEGKQLIENEHDQAQGGSGYMGRDAHPSEPSMFREVHRTVTTRYPPHAGRQGVSTHTYSHVNKARKNYQSDSDIPEHGSKPRFHDHGDHM